MEEYLRSTEFMDSDSGEIMDFARSRAWGAADKVGKAIRLYFAVRDEVRYDPYRMDLSRQGFKASTTLLRGYGFCVAKAVLLAAAGRAEGIPTRLRFADVRNHLTTERLKRLMGSDVFFFHGYTEFFLRDRWVKATPTFNVSLCQRFNVRPLDFDGEHDAIFHEFDQSGNRHMEYLRDHGSYADLPYDKVIEVLSTYYSASLKPESPEAGGDFEAEAALEKARGS